MLDFLDINFILNRVMPYLDRGLLMSLQLIVPASLIGGFIGVVMGVLRVLAHRGYSALLTPLWP